MGGVGWGGSRQQAAGMVCAPHTSGMAPEPQLTATRDAARREGGRGGMLGACACVYVWCAWSANRARARTSDGWRRVALEAMA